MNVGDPWQWYQEIPIVSRVYLTASVLTTAACALELVSPFTLYFNYKLIYEKGQVWRLATNFLFFGMFSIDYLLHMYFLVRYCRLLEENSFRGRTADFVLLLLLACALMMLLAPFVNIPFFGSSLSFMMVYLWGRRNRHVQMSFLGLFPFTAPYLPWVLLSVSLFLGNSAAVDFIGICTGHLYFYLDDIYPEIARLRGWRVNHPLRVPRFVRVLLGEVQSENVTLVEQIQRLPEAQQEQQQQQQQQQDEEQNEQQDEQQQQQGERQEQEAPVAQTGHLHQE